MNINITITLSLSINFFHCTVKALEISSSTLALGNPFSFTLPSAMLDLLAKADGLKVLCFVNLLPLAGEDGNMEDELLVVDVFNMSVS